MNKIIPMKLGDGVLYVEMEEVDIEALSHSGTRNTSEFEDIPEDARPVGFKEVFQNGIVTLRSSINLLAEDVADSLEKAAPHEWSLEFSIGFKGKVNPVPVLVSGESNASLKVTAKWKRE